MSKERMALMDKVIKHFGFEDSRTIAFCEFAENLSNSIDEVRVWAEIFSKE